MNKNRPPIPPSFKKTALPAGFYIPSPNLFKLFVALFAFLLPCSSSSASGLKNGFLNSGGTVHSNQASAISIGNIDQRRLFQPPQNRSSPNKKNAPQNSKTPDGSYQLGEVYAFPNPAKHGKKPTVHVEAGIAESVEFRFYDTSGELVHRAELRGSPQIIDDGQGPEYAYEYPWEGQIPSGTYLCAITAHKSGEPDLKRTCRIAVIR